MRHLPRFLAVLLACGTGCQAPRFPLPIQGAREHAAAVLALHRDYGLPLPPPCAVDVFWPAFKEPARFTLAVGEPDWRLEAPLEPLAVTAQEAPGGTTFTWALTPEPVREAFQTATRPILLRWSRGADVRAVIVPCRATRYRGPEPPRVPGPGSFHLVVHEPGWSLAGVLQPLQVRTQPGAAETVFDWDLPADQMVPLGRPGWELLLSLSKGRDHRPLIFYCQADTGHGLHSSRIRPDPSSS